MRKETAFLAMLTIAALSGCRRERLQESFVAIDNGLIVNALDETRASSTRKLATTVSQG